MDVSDERYVSNSIKHEQADQSVLSHTDKDIWHQIIMDFRQALTYTCPSMVNMGRAWQTANSPCGLLELSTDWVSSSSVPWKSPFFLHSVKNERGEAKIEICGREWYRIAYKVFFIFLSKQFLLLYDSSKDLGNVFLAHFLQILLCLLAKPSFWLIGINERKLCSTRRFGWKR